MLLYTILFHPVGKVKAGKDAWYRKAFLGWDQY